LLEEDGAAFVIVDLTSWLVDGASFVDSGDSDLVFSKLGCAMGEVLGMDFEAVGAGVSKAPPGDEYAGGSSSLEA
jgi:hypothetical protein